MVSVLRRLRSAQPVTLGARYYGVFWGAMAFYHPFLNVYFSQIGFSGTQIGLLAMVLPLVTLVVSPLVARLADLRRMRVRILGASVLALAPTLLTFLIPRSFIGMLLPMVLHAVVRSPTEPLADAITARMARVHRVDFGAMRLWGSLIWAPAVLAAGWLWQVWPPAAIFVLTAVLLLPAAAAAFSLPEPPLPPTSGQARPSFREIGWNAAVLGMASASMLIGIGVGMNATFVGVHLDHLGGTAWVGAYFAVTALSEWPTLRWGSRLAGRWGHIRMLLLAYAVCGLGYLGYASAEQPWVLVAFSVMYGMGYGLNVVLTVQIIDRMAPGAWSATLQSLIMGVSVFGIARLVAGPLGGVVYDGWGPRWLFILAAGCCLLALIALLASRKAILARIAAVDEAELQPAI